MAKKIVQPVEVQASVKGDSSVKSFKAQIREAQQEALRLAAAFGETDARTLAAAKRVAELKDRMDDVNQTIKSLHPDKFQAVANITGTLANGFAAAQGAAALLGGESQDLQKAMLKVQGAMAFSQGISGLKDIKNQLGGVKALIIDSVVPAFTTAAGAAKMLRNALGIGLIISAVTALIAIFNKLDFSIDGVSKTDKKLLDQQKQKLKAAQDNVESLDAQDNILKAQGKSENDILRLKIAALKVAIDNQKAVIETSKAQAKSQIAAAQRNKDILVGILNFISAPMRLLLQTIDSVAEKLGYETGLLKNFDAATNSIAEMAFDPKETKKLADEDQKEMEKALTESRNTLAGHELAIKANDKAARDERKKQADDEAAKAKQRAQDAIDRDIAMTEIEADGLGKRQRLFGLAWQQRLKELKEKGYSEIEIQKIWQAEMDKIRTTWNNEQAAKQKSLDDLMKSDREKALQAELNFINNFYAAKELLVLQEQKDAEGNVITEEQRQAKLKQIRLDALRDEIRARKDVGQSAIEQEKEYQSIQNDIAKTASEQRSKDLKKEAEARQRDIEMGVNAAQSMLTLFDALTTNSNAKSEEQRKKEFERKKKFEMAAAIMSTISSAQAAYQSQMASAAVGDVTAPIRASIAAATAMAQGLARVAMISKQSYQASSPPSGGGGMSGGGAMRPSMPSTAAGLPGGSEMAGGAAKVFVTESDISATQGRVKALKAGSVI